MEDERERFVSVLVTTNADWIKCVESRKNSRMVPLLSDLDDDDGDGSGPLLYNVPNKKSIVCHMLLKFHEP